MGRHNRIIKTNPLIISSDLETEWTMAEEQKMFQETGIFVKRTIKD
jgi:hypothetical protein